MVTILNKIFEGAVNPALRVAKPNRVLKNKNLVVRQGARRFDKRGIFKYM